MSEINLSDFIHDVSSQILSKNSAYIVDRITEIVTASMNEPMYVDEDTSKLIGVAAAASVKVSVELSTAVTASVLSSLGILEHDGHPHLRVVKKPEN